MSAIKLPVKAEPDRSDRWKVSDGDGNPISMWLRPDHAIEIERKLNLHDDLVNALRFYARHPSECRNRVDGMLPGNANDWNADICNDGGEIARTALALAESVETKV